MKKRFRLSVSLLLLFSIFFISASYTKWIKDFNYQGIEFKKVRFQTEGSDTLVIEGYLEQATNIEGIPCCDYIALKKGCKVMNVTLSEDFYMFDINFPKGSLLRFHEDGLSCYLSSNTMVQEYLCSGNYIKKMNKALKTSFHPNGELKWFYPPEDVMIGQINCKSGGQAGIGLHINGSLKQCTLSQDQSINGVAYKKNIELSFDEVGNVIKEKG